MGYRRSFEEWHIDDVYAYAVLFLYYQYGPSGFGTLTYNHTHAYQAILVLPAEAKLESIIGH